MQGLEILFIWQFSFPLKEASHAINPGGTEEEILMHGAGGGKMVFGDCIALCSISASSAG